MRNKYPKGHILQIVDRDNPNDTYPDQKWLMYKETIIDIPVANGTIGRKVQYWIRVK